MPTSPAPVQSAQDASDLWEVAVSLPLDRTLTYRLPPELTAAARVGSLVRVPVGRQVVTGYLLAQVSEAPPVRIRRIKAVLDPIPRFGPELAPLFRWLAGYYQYPLGEALSRLIPGGERIAGGRLETWAAPVSEDEAPPLPSRLGPKASALLHHLRSFGPAWAKDLRAIFPGCRPSLRRLADLGLLRLDQRLALQDPLESQPGNAIESSLTLAPEQAEALTAITEGLASGQFAPCLLHGVTASGKTEVYLAAAGQALNLQRQVLVLLPEIALTHPVAQAFRARFGSRVTVLHSGLSEAARLDQWRRIILGEVDVVVGARSAVFAPLPRLGLVVVDEEHDPAYKQEGGLLYQARDVALYRGKLAAATVVLVSATPQISTYHSAVTGKYHYLNLSRRVTPQTLPEIHLIDLKTQRGDKSAKIISRPLLTALEGVLARQEQALLFLNRRGYARALFCLFCGHVFQCRQCSVALTKHQSANRLICHYCGFSQEIPEHCPQCQSTAIKQYGLGTEKVESEVRRLLPGAKVARLDRDIAPHSGKALNVFESFAAGRLDILIGTQMIAKGHHFPRVTLVGVVAADLSLFFPEYHAGERTFQLLSQVAGRAGRGEVAGQVLIQTFQPEHHVFQMVQAHDYVGFYTREIEARRSLGYPPFTRLALVRVSGSIEKDVIQEAKRLAAALRKALQQDEQSGTLVQVLGPAPAGVSRLKGRYRWQLLLKSYGRPALAAALQHLRRLCAPPVRAHLDLTLDIDPANLF
ncbi:MAG: primosomal protein N' [Deltaproteobacteria bacterium]|nr:primosomal protein N' [Deltaproteobacteria bacterium]